MRLVRHRAAASIVVGSLLVAKFALSQPGPGGPLPTGSATPPVSPASSAPTASTTGTAGTPGTPGASASATAAGSAPAPTESAAPVPTPPPVVSAPVAPPRMSASAAPKPVPMVVASASAAPVTPPGMHETPPYIPANHTLGIEFAMGLAARMSDFPTTSPQNESAGLSYHAGLQYGPSRLWSVGLQYAMTNAGTEKSLGTQSDKEYSIDRNIHSFLLELRMHPLPPVNKRVIRFFVSLLAGASFEHVAGTFSSLAAINSAQAPGFQTVKYSGNGDLGFALGAGLGADVELGGGLALIVRTTFTAHGLNDKAIADDPLGRVRGSGTTTIFDARGGLQYRFDLGGGK